MHTQFAQLMKDATAHTRAGDLRAAMGAIARALHRSDARPPPPAPVVADDAVALVLGPKWLEMAPLVAVLAFAMPMFTLYSLFGPAVTALGRTGITMKSAMIGAVVMSAAFLLGIRWGVAGLAWAWVLAFPVVPLAAFIQARGPLGLSVRGTAGAIAPGLAASAAMAMVVALAEFALEGLASWQRLPLLVALGGASYLALLLITSRAALVEVIGLLSRPKPQPEWRA